VHLNSIHFKKKRKTKRKKKKTKRDKQHGRRESNIDPKLQQYANEQEAQYGLPNTWVPQHDHVIYQILFTITLT
jgi:hypothetical protein